ncbi:MAG TPA: DNA primase [Thermoanaerobaculia bacterium]|jgi:DNA primase|nr:DNA primase [Thermoanaerobaculia bacterium]
MALGNVHLTPQLIQAVRDAADILNVASEHTRLQKAGRRYQGLCPLHKEKSPSFGVDPGPGLFYCFGCGQGGDAIKLHMLLSGDDFPAAIESLARRYGIPLPAAPERRGGRDERDLEGALAAAQGYFVDQLKRSTFARGYLEKRGIPGALIDRFGLGFAPDGWRGLFDALRGKIPVGDLEAAGLVARPERSAERQGGDPYDRFRNRLMFPIKNAAGRLVGFGGRALGDDKAKYVNTSETASFHKGNLLYGLDQAKRAIRESGRAILVEGYFDVLGAVACGLEGAVAGMGTALTPEQAKLLKRYAEEAVIAYDGDSAGENAFRRALPLLLSEGLAVRRARFPDGHDPDSLRLAQGPEAVAAAVADAPDGVVAELERVAPAESAHEPREQAKAAAAVAELLRPIPDAILRWSYARVAAERIQVPAELMSRRMGSEAPSPNRGETPRTSGLPPESPSPALRGKRLVRTTEEQVLEFLLAGEALPALSELPEPEAFLDAECRNIFRAFVALYGRSSGSPPDVRSVRTELEPDDRAIARLSQIVIEGAVTLGKPGLSGSLEKLVRRWQQQRLKDLASEILRAERAGDHVRLERLLAEKTRLARSLHSRNSRMSAGDSIS